jgi:methionyl-tRNA formyltransferase
VKLLNNNVIYQPQDETKATFAPTLSKQDGHLDFASQTSTQIINRMRAMDPWPGTFCFLNGKRLKVLELDRAVEKISPGKIANSNGRLIVGCQDGSLQLSFIQLEGKKACSDRELLNGLRDELNLTSPT